MSRRTSSQPWPVAALAVAALALPLVATEASAASATPAASATGAPLDSVDTYTYNFDPYVPEIVQGQLSDDLTSIATDLANGLRHFRSGNVAEALWWWQFSYLASWGESASAALRALQSVVAHDRLDTDFEGETDQIAAAEAVLDGGVVGS